MLRRRAALGAFIGLATILSTSGPPVAGDSSLRAAWAFSEGTGTTAADESGNGNTATLNGATWTASGKFDAAAVFDGVDDRLDVADANALDLSSALTIEAWVYLDASGSARTLLAKEDTSGIVYGLFLTSGSAVELRVLAGGTLRTLASVTSLSTATWTHVAGTYDGTSLRVWINGLEENSLAATGAIAASSQPLRIGGDTVVNQPFAGRLDEVRVYSRALGATEIVADMDVAVDDVTPPTVSSRSPAASATGVAVGADVTAAFNEWIAPATVTGATFELRDGQGTLVPATVSYAEATKTASLNPTSDLAGSTTYTATLKGAPATPRITDLPGNPLAADVSWSFTTVDNLAPTVTSVTPAAAARNVSLSTTLTATFDEPIDPATVTTSTFELRDTRNVLVAGSVSYDAPTRTATFTPDAPLLPTRTYTATLIGGGSGLKDLAANALAANYGWTFISTVERVRIAAGDTHSVAVDDAGQVWTWGGNVFGQRGTTLDPRLPGAVTAASAAVSVAAGTNHTLALWSDGTLRSWGANSEGQLGNGNQTNQSTPVTVGTVSGVIAIAAGRQHSVALKSDGTVWTWGAGAQIGDGANTRRLTPVQVTALSDVIAIAASNDHTLALAADGTVWAWGANTAGQLGDGSTSPRLTPVQVGSLSGVVGIAAGERHSLAIVGSDLSVRAWGGNEFGQLGDDSKTQRTSPVAVSGLTNIRQVAAGGRRSGAAALDGTARAWGNRSTAGGLESQVPIVTPGNPPAWQVAVGTTHTLTVTADGIVSALANGISAGQLGDGTFVGRPSAVPISESPYVWKTSTPSFSPGTSTFTAAVNVTVSALTSGSSIRYTIDGTDPTESSDLVPSTGIVAVNSSLTLKAKAWKTGKPPSNVDSSVYTLKVPAPTVSVTNGTYTVPQNVVVSVSVPDVALHYTTNGVDPTTSDPQITSGGSVTVDQTTTLKIRGWKEGWLPSDITSRTYTMQVASATFSPASGTCSAPCLVTVSTITPGATLRYTAASRDPLPSDPVVASGSSVELTESGALRVKGWRTGWSDSGVAIVSYSVTHGTVAAPVAAPAGGTYTAAQLVTLSSATAGAVIRYTLNGSEPTASSAVYTSALSVAAPLTLRAKAFKANWTPSAETSEAYVFDYGTVAIPTLAPGAGDYATAQTVTVTTATADATIRYTLDGLDPTESSASVASGGTIVIDRPLRLKVKAFKAAMTPSPVRAADYGITGALAAGNHHSVALKADGTVWTWGFNNEGQLGNGTTTQGNSPAMVAGLANIVAVAAGHRHTVALRADGVVFAWGRNTERQLGDGGTTERRTPHQLALVTDVVAIAAGDWHTVALKRDGTVWTWGDALGGNPTNPVQLAALTGVVAIAAGEGHSAALKSDGALVGTVWTWGENPSGELGDGTLVSRAVPAPAFAPATRVFAARRLTFVRSADGRLWGWGANGDYRIGDGTTTRRELPVLVPHVTDPLAVDVGVFNTYALTTDGALWAWGAALGTGLGMAGSDSPVHVPLPNPSPRAGHGNVGLAVGESYRLFSGRDGKVYAWGGNSSGQLGLGDTTHRDLAPVLIPGFTLVDGSWLTGDPDADGLVTWRELLAGTDPRKADTNGDGLLDGAAVGSGTSPTSSDVDGDGLTNAAEQAAGTDVFRADTDGDGVTDGLDAFPLDPSRSQPPMPNPSDTTPPVINLIYPSTAVPIPPV